MFRSVRLTLFVLALACCPICTLAGEVGHAEPSDHQVGDLEVRKAAVLQAQEAGRSDEAAKLADELIEASQRLGEHSQAYADALSMRAWIYISASQYEHAQDLFNSALAIYRAQPDTASANRFTARILNNLGHLNQVQGRLDVARKHYESALLIQDEHLEPNDLDRAATLGNIAYLDLLGKDFDLAEKLLRRALDIRRHGKPHPAAPPEIAMTLQALASADEGRGKLLDAETSLREAVKLRRNSQSPTAVQLAGAIQRLAGNLHRQKRLTEAARLHEEAITIRRQSRELPLDLAINLVEQAKLKIDLRQHDLADADLEEAISIYKRVIPEGHMRVAEAYYHRASVAIARRDLAGELRWSREAAKGFMSASTGEVALARIGFQAFVQSAWRAQNSTGGKSSEGGLADEAFFYAQYGASSTTTRTIALLAARLASQNPELAKLVRDGQDADRLMSATSRQLMEASATSDGRNTATEIRKRLIESKAKQEANDRSLSENFKTYFDLVKPNPVTLSEVQSSLMQDEILIFIFETFDDVYLWTVTRDQVRWHKADIQSQELRSVVSKMRTDLNASPESSTSKYSILQAHQLYRRLLGKSDSLLSGKRHLINVTSGALSAIPLHTLVRKPPKTGSGASPSDYRAADWLIRSVAISNLPSLASLRNLRPAQAPTTPDARKPLLGFANPLYQSRAPNEQAQVASLDISSGRRNRAADKNPNMFWKDGAADLDALRSLTALEETQAELTSVAQSVGVPTDSLHFGADASETTIKRLNHSNELDQYRVLYFAMHGLAPSPQNGMNEPALAMAVPAVASEQDDGLLTTSEIAHLRLNADWVVLSACDTSSGEAFGAEELSGLAKAFFYAGSRAVLVTKWSISSSDARDLMIETFHQMQKDAQLRKSEALRRSMLRRIDEPVPGPDGLWAPYPGYWGPFDLIVGTSY